MNKAVKIVVVDVDQVVKGSLLEVKTTMDAFDLTYVDLEKQEIAYIPNLKNAKISDKKHIKTSEFEKDIVDIYENLGDYLQEFAPNKIRVFVNETWKKSKQSKPNSCIPGEIKKVPGSYNEQTGIEYSITVKRFFLEDWSREQRVAFFFGMLKKIQEDGSIRVHHIDEQDDLVVTLGSDYLEKGADVPNLLEGDIKLKKIPKAKKRQIEMDIDDSGNAKLNIEEGPGDDDPENEDLELEE